MNRLGFHYYPDTYHYSQRDVETWLPRLKELGAGWLVLQTPSERALPESFVRSLLEASIEPLLHFPLALEQTYNAQDFEILFKSYARWGVRYVALFDRPNLRRAWGGIAWTQTELVERFIDRYLPLAEACLDANLTPVFPPLEPGGDYWDTSFLKAALESLQRRGKTGLLNKLVLGAYARAGEHPLDWGAGGPERWPGGLPYYTPPDEQDQRGFRIFDWYSAVTRSVLNTPRPIFLFGMDATLGEGQNEKRLAIAQLLNNAPVAGMEAIPETVLGGAFWLLAAPEGHEAQPQAWYQPDGTRLPIVDTLAQTVKNTPKNASPAPGENAKIAHYLLLPSYEWGIPEKYLESIWPYVKKHQPTVGFSIDEAAQAHRITVIGTESDFPETKLRELRAQGSIVERIEADGMNLATLVGKYI